MVSPFLIWREFIHAIEVNGFSIGLQFPEPRVTAKDQTSEEVFPESGGLIGLGNEDVITNGHCDITGKNQVGYWIKKDSVFRFQIARNEGVRQLFGG